MPKRSRNGVEKRPPFIIKPFRPAKEDAWEDDARSIRAIFSQIIRARVERIQDRHRGSILVVRNKSLQFEPSYRTIYEACLRSNVSAWDFVRKEQMPYLALEHARSGDWDGYEAKLGVLHDLSLYPEQKWCASLKLESTKAMGRRLWDSCYSNPQWRARHLLWRVLMRRLRVKLLAMAHFLERFTEIAFRPGGSGYAQAMNSFAVGCARQLQTAEIARILPLVKR